MRPQPTGQASHRAGPRHAGRVARIGIGQLSQPGFQHFDRLRIGTLLRAEDACCVQDPPAATRMCVALALTAAAMSKPRAVRTGRQCVVGAVPCGGDAARLGNLHDGSPVRRPPEGRLERLTPGIYDVDSHRRRRQAAAECVKCPLPAVGDGQLRAERPPSLTPVAMAAATLAAVYVPLKLSGATRIVMPWRGD